MSELHNNENETQIITPSQKTLTKAAQMAISIEKPICLDYYKASLNKECKIGLDGQDKVLYKNESEYTSPLQSMFKIVDDNQVGNSEYILETQNSIYIISGAMLA